ncbi:PAS domain-containing protein [Halorubellus sp. PRR65]|uniref:PAS domain-containing sensor histidine kinase n=1 Tax=Halorubellus sp. PRR65 TaxID=3098148 RepID=UPI002B2627EE|nr:PAS domain-containing protein [Halorubellus sp. PRR65]
MTDRFERLLDRASDAVYAVDTDWRIEYMNETMAARVDRRREAVVGTVLWEAFPAIVGTELEATYREAMESGDAVTFEEYLDDPVDYWVEGRAFPDEHGLTIFSRDVTERREREATLLDVTERLNLAIEGANLGVWDWNVRTNEVQYNDNWATVLGYDPAEIGTGLEEWSGRVHPDDLKATTEVMEAHLAGETAHYEDEHRIRAADGDWKWIRTVGKVFERGDDGEPLRAVGIHLDVTERRRSQEALRALQRVAADLTEADSIQDIADFALDAASDVLDLHLTAIWRYDERTGALEPVAQTDAARAAIGGDQPRFTAEEPSLAWQAFESDTVGVYEALADVDDVYNPGTAFRSELIVPLEGVGVLTAASTEAREFSETDRDLFRILGSAVKAAMVRERRATELRRQNERLDDFASVVAHDLRNPLSVATMFTEQAIETGDLAYLGDVADAHDRMAELIDDVLTLARAHPSLEDPEPVRLGRAAVEAWEYVDTANASLSVEDAVPVVAGDKSRLTQLFENLFRNAVEHGSPCTQAEPENAVEHGSPCTQAEPENAVEHGTTSTRPQPGDAVEHGSTSNQTQSGDANGNGAPDPDSSCGETADSGDSATGDDGEITITVGVLQDRNGFYVADDGVGVDPDLEGDLFEHGVTSSADGTGFGLSIVSDIAHAHGWSVSLAESAGGGARFEFETPTDD